MLSNAAKNEDTCCDAESTSHVIVIANYGAQQNILIRKLFSRQYIYCLLPLMLLL